MAVSTLLALVTTATAAAAAPAGPTPMSLAPESSVTFEAFQSIGTTKGRFETFTGTFRIDLADVSKTSVELTIDAVSIDTDNGSRDDHLRNEDFFHVEKHPKIVFRSDAVEARAKGQVRVKGKLQIKAKTVPVTLDLQVTPGPDGAVKAFGRLQVSRKRLGIDWEAPFYLPGVKDNVNLTFDLRLRPG